MRYLKLKQVNESVTLTVTACAPATSGQYPGIVFEGDANGERVGVELPPSSAQRQLSRLNLDSSSVVGQTITISRDPNPAKPASPYWGIVLALPSQAKAQPASRRLNPGDEAKPLPDAPPLEFAPPEDEPLLGSPNPGIAGLKSQNDGKAASLEAMYLRLFDRVALHISHRLDCDMAACSDAVQAATASIFRESCKRGLV